MTTTCSLPPALTDQHLWEALDGIADESITSHLQKCPYCQSRANALENMQSRLKSRLFRATCPPSLELAEFFARTLPDPQKLIISAHVRGCPHCMREIANLTKSLGTDVIQVQDRSTGKTQVRVATPLGGTSTAGALRGENKIITLQVDDTVLTFDVQSEPRGMISLLGQIAAEDQDLWTGAVVTLLQEGSPQQTASVSDLGAFHFSAIQPGESQLTIISLHDVIIKVPPLILKT